jgi:predicted RNase H-like nuclease (RuvC/YqgF family)
MSDTMIAIVGSVVTGILLKAGDWLINRSKDSRDARKDLREEIADLWDRIDELEKARDEKNAKIVELQSKIGEEMFWKQRFTAENLKTQMLERKLDDMQKHITILEIQIKELQR